MGLFDWYEPTPAVLCPVCGQTLEGWQGKDSENGLFLWRQGHASPVDQLVDDDCRIDLTIRETLRLPQSFTIYTDGCACQRRIEAMCTCVGNVWSRTELVTAENARIVETESPHQFRARVADLHRWMSRQK